MLKQMLKQVLKRGARLEFFLLLLVVSVLVVYYRLPLLLSPIDINSDFAFPALHAKHILLGEFNLFLWGSGYQSSLELYPASLAFYLFGISDLAYMGSALFGYWLGLIFICATLSRFSAPWKIFCLILPSLFLFSDMIPFTLYLPRPYALAILFFSVWLADRASLRPNSASTLGLVVFLQFLVLFLDFYFISFFPAGILFAVLCAWAGRPSPAEFRKRKIGLGVGFVLGACVLAFSRLAATGGAPLAFTPATLFSWEQKITYFKCLARVLGIVEPPVFSAELGIWFLSLAASVGFFVLLLAAVYRGVFARIPDPRRKRLAIYGAVCVTTTLLGCAGSSMMGGMHAARYLAAMIFVAPFALIPLLEIRRFEIPAVFLVGFSLVMFLNTWKVFENHQIANGLVPKIVENPWNPFVAELDKNLEARGIRYACTDYWDSYRITWMLNESKIVVPCAKGANRYEPYWAGFETAEKRATLVKESSERLVEEHRAHLVSTNRLLEEFKLVDFVVFVEKGT